jgi:hypothetical protein
MMKLVGIVHGPGAPMAMILVDGVVRQVPTGQLIKGTWQVTSINPSGSVAVSNGRQSFVLQLGLGQIY